MKIEICVIFSRLHLFIIIRHKYIRLYEFRCWIFWAVRMPDKLIIYWCYNSSFLFDNRIVHFNVRKDIYYMRCWLKCYNRLKQSNCFSLDLGTTSFECVNDFEWYERCYFYTIPVLCCVSSTFLYVLCGCCYMCVALWHVMFEYKFYMLQIMWYESQIFWIHASFVSSCIHVVDESKKHCCISIQKSILWLRLHP